MLMLKEALRSWRVSRALVAGAARYRGDAGLCLQRVWERWLETIRGLAGRAVRSCQG